MTAGPSTDPELVLETAETIWRAEALLDKVKDYSQHVEQRLNEALGKNEATHQRPSHGPVLGPGQPRL
jgi:hypothetical protein